MKNKLKQVGNAVLAAVTSPTAVKAEKSVATLVIVRVALALGASAALVEILQKAFA